MELKVGNKPRSRIQGKCFRKMADYFANGAKLAWLIGLKIPVDELFR